MSNKRIVFLTGSGFTCSSEFSSITTKILTEKLKNEKFNLFHFKKIKIAKIIDKILKKHYGLPSKINDYNVINFETIIYFVEELYSFLESKKLISNADYKGINASLFKLKDYIFLTFLNKRSNLNASIVQEVFLKMISLIINEFKKFNSDSANIGMNNFFKNFIDIYFKDSQWTKRFYTLNYDSWILNYKNYFDGFKISGEFDPESVLINKIDENSHYNLHGCITWHPDLSEFRYKRNNIIFNPVGVGQPPDFGVDREPIIRTPIITGYNKLTRVNFSPFMEFNYSFQRDLLDCEFLIIIGYSFHDTHINNILKLFTYNNHSNKKVVIVDYFNDYTDNDKFDLIRYDDDILKYLQRMNPYHVSLLECKVDDNDFITSNDESIKIWFKGIGNEFYDKWNSIIK